MPRTYTIALVGNPNSGKSSLFNVLTGLNQKVGNFPGVTVDKKTGIARITEALSAHIIDLPGTYSLYPKSADEQVTYEVLLNQKSTDRPDLIVVIADASNLKRNLLFCTQIIDLKIPVIIALTMMDIARQKGITIDSAGLRSAMGVPVVAINPRKNKGIGRLKKAISDMHGLAKPPASDFMELHSFTGEWLSEIKELCSLESNYAALHIACNYLELRYISAAQRIRIAAILGESGFQKSKVQAEEIMQRYKRIESVMKLCVVQESPMKRMVASEKIDKFLLHPVWGNLTLFAVLFLLFQSIFWLARYPMDWMQQGFASLGSLLNTILPNGLLSDLLVNGVVAGVSGVAVFVPQKFVQA